MAYKRHLAEPLTPFQLYDTRLRNILRSVELSLEELQYIQEREFRKFRNVGGGLLAYTKALLAEKGLTFGNNTYHYYIGHRKEIQSQPKPQGDQVKGELIKKIKEVRWELNYRYQKAIRDGKNEAFIGGMAKAYFLAVDLIDKALEGND